MDGQVENVVLIVIDALRADRVAAHSGGCLTPNIDEVADEGEVFENCFACANATDPSVTSILTGLYPTRHGVINHGSNVTETERTHVSATSPLPEILDNSHRSVAMDWLGRWHRRGFDEYIDPRIADQGRVFSWLAEAVRKLPEPVKTGVARVHGRVSSSSSSRSEAQVMGEQALGVIEGAHRPFFLFAHFWETHVPYVPLDQVLDEVAGRTYEDGETPLAEVLDRIDGSSWRERLKSGLLGDATTVGDMKRRYDAGVWRVDQVVGDIVETLKQQGIYDETALVVTADHGESFTEHGIVFDHHGLYDPSVHVPLIVRAPSFEGRERQFVQHYDLVPTLLDLLGQEYGPGQFDGTSLVPEGDERALDRTEVLAEEAHTSRKRMLRTRTHKYITRLDSRDDCRYCGVAHAADEELYDLETDPGELQNVADAHPELLVELEERMTTWIEGLPDPSTDESAYEVTEDVEDRLEKMGYL